MDLSTSRANGTRTSPAVISLPRLPSCPGKESQDQQEQDMACIRIDSGFEDSTPTPSAIKMSQTPSATNNTNPTHQNLRDDGESWNEEAQPDSCQCSAAPTPTTSTEQSYSLKTNDAPASRTREVRITTYREPVQHSKASLLHQPRRSSARFLLNRGDRPHVDSRLCSRFERRRQNSGNYGQINADEPIPDTCSLPPEPTPSPPPSKSAATPTPQTVNWLSPMTRLEEYRRIDKGNCGFRGLWKKAKKMMGRKKAGGFWKECEEDDDGDGR